MFFLLPSYIYIYIYIYNVFPNTRFDYKFTGIQKNSFKNCFIYENKIELSIHFSCKMNVIIKAECFSLTITHNTVRYIFEIAYVMRWNLFRKKPWATETVLSPWLAANEVRVSHVLSHVVWWKFEIVYVMRWNLFRKKDHIVLWFENKGFAVYHFKCQEKGSCYKWKLKSFSIIFAKEDDIL